MKRAFFFIAGLLLLPVGAGVVVYAFSLFW